jgi:acyl carrier protein
MQQDQVRETVKSFILEEFLPGEDPKELTNGTPLVSGGILDSIATLKLISFLEETYDIEVEPHEADHEHFNTLDDICALVESKL